MTLQQQQQQLYPQQHVGDGAELLDLALHVREFAAEKQLSAATLMRLEALPPDLQKQVLFVEWGNEGEDVSESVNDFMRQLLGTPPPFSQPVQPRLPHPQPPNSPPPQPLLMQQQQQLAQRPQPPPPPPPLPRRQGGNGTASGANAHWDDRSRSRGPAGACVNEEISNVEAYRKVNGPTRYLGTMKKSSDFGGSSKFRFIYCKELNERFGHDVYVNYRTNENVMDVAEGSIVSFALTDFNGRKQAADVQVVRGPVDTPPSSMQPVPPPVRPPGPLPVPVPLPVRGEVTQTREVPLPPPPRRVRSAQMVEESNSSSQGRWPLPPPPPVRGSGGDVWEQQQWAPPRGPFPTQTAGGGGASSRRPPLPPPPPPGRRRDLASGGGDGATPGPTHDRTLRAVLPPPVPTPLAPLPATTVVPPRPGWHDSQSKLTMPPPSPPAQSLGGRGSSSSPMRADSARVPVRGDSPSPSAVCSVAAVSGPASLAPDDEAWDRGRSPSTAHAGVTTVASHASPEDDHSSVSSSVVSCHEDGEEERREDMELEEEEDETSPELRLLEVTNLPDLNGKGAPPEQYLAEMFNPTLRILPEFDSGRGQPVRRAWSPAPGVIVIEMQSAGLRDSTVRTLDGFDLFEKRLRLRAIAPGEAADIMPA